MRYLGERLRFNCDQRAKYGQVGAAQQVWVLRSRVFAECDLTSDASRRSAPSAGPGPEVPGEMAVWRRGGATGIQQTGVVLPAGVWSPVPFWVYLDLSIESSELDTGLGVDLPLWVIISQESTYFLFSENRN